MDYLKHLPIRLPTRTLVGPVAVNLRRVWNSFKLWKGEVRGAASRPGFAARPIPDSGNAMTRPRRILYALGPGDAVCSYREWRQGRDFTGETSITGSGQFFDYCRQTGTEGFALSSHPRRDIVREGLFVVENRPKRLASASGAMYHLSQLHYAASILWTALRRRPDALIVDSGTTHWFLLAPLRIARIPVIASLHNVLWPTGFPPSRPSRRLLLWLAGWFWRHIAQATICVSPECERQVYT